MEETTRRALATLRLRLERREAADTPPAPPPVTTDEVLAAEVQGGAA